MSTMRLAVLMCLVGFTATAAQAKVMDFEMLKVNTNAEHNFGVLYIEDGFMVLNAGPGGLSYYGTGHANFNGSAALHTSSQAAVSLASISGRTLHLKSIDLAPLGNASGPFSVTFSAINNKGVPISQTFSNDGTSTNPLTYLLNGFKHVAWVQWTATGGGYQFDNIRVENAPEPGSALLALFIGGVGVPMLLGRWTRNAGAEAAAPLA